MAAAAGTAELVGGGHPGALGADAPSACKVARSAHADDVTCCRRDDCSRPREPDSARLLDELLEHLPATAQAVSWVQDLSASEPGRRCISAVSRAFTCVLPFLQEASSSTDRARSTSSSLDSKSAPDGEQHSALKFQTGLESARIVCADSWRALHAPGQHWRTVDGRWREAYSLGCMLRAIHLLWQHCSDTDGPAGHGARVHIHPGMPSQLRIVQGHCGDEESLRGDELERLDAAGSPTSGGEGGDGQWWTVEDPRGLDEPGKHTAQNIGGAVSKDIEALRWLDLALLFGGSRARVHVHRMIARLSRAIAECPPTSAYTHPTPSPAARRAGATGEGASCQAGGEGGGRALVAARGRLRTAIERCQAPSLIGFKTRFLDPAHAVVLTGAVDHWPALRKWSSWEYVKAVAGERSVPVEVGKHYLSSAWHQRLMSVGQLIDSFTLDPKPQPIGSSASGHGGAGGGAGGMLYMAQHDLFEQVPDLRRDILVPDYTALPVRDGRVPDEFVTNAWLGPGGTVSPLHFDDYENILVQVVGRKYVRLYHPRHTHLLYPRGAGQDFNSSHVVDVEGLGLEGETVTQDNDDEIGAQRYHDTGSRTVGTVMEHNGDKGVGGAQQGGGDTRDSRERFPLFKEAPYSDVELGPGEALFIPRGHWHYVRSLEPSFSVSFWWR